MSKVKIACKANDNYIPKEVQRWKANNLVGYQEIKCHVIFDIKMDFMQKARFVAG
jgi:hypothetical protein